MDMSTTLLSREGNGTLKVVENAPGYPDVVRINRKISTAADPDCSQLRSCNSLCGRSRLPSFVSGEREAVRAQARDGTEFRWGSRNTPEDWWENGGTRTLTLLADEKR
jgi:hypothetical protein